jgi:hypothetical protein
MLKQKFSFTLNAKQVILDREERKRKRAYRGAACSVMASWYPSQSTKKEKNK